MSKLSAGESTALRGVMRYKVSKSQNRITEFFLLRQCHGENSVLGEQTWWLLMDKFYCKKKKIAFMGGVLQQFPTEK